MPPTLAALLELDSEDTPIVLLSAQWLDWGRILVFEGKVGDKAFTLRYEDCREIRWRAYVALDDAPGMPTPVVDFAPGRDQHRSPAQFLTGTFGATLFYGSAVVSIRTAGEP